MNTHVAEESRALAREALSYLDRGDLAGIRRMLEAIAGEPDWKHPVKMGIPKSAETSPSSDLTASAMSCIVGTGWSHFFDTAQCMTVDGGLLDATQVARLNTYAIPGLNDLIPAMSVVASADSSWVNSLKSQLVLDPSVLDAAHECMTNIASMYTDLKLPHLSDANTFRTPIHDDALRTLLRAQRAAQSYGERAMRRLVWTARECGLAQREIAGLVERPQTLVFRQLKAIDENPSLLALRPRDILDVHLSGHLDRPTLLKMLSAYPYTSGEFPAEEPDWAYVPGSWDELSQMAIEGDISRDELELIVAASKARSERHG